jgi:dolichyldiphosphatase
MFMIIRPFNYLIFLPDWLIAHLGTGYGMPSSHSQFMAFFALLVILHTHYNIRLDHPRIKWLLYLPTVALSILVMYSRIHLAYHTPEQVLVGSGIGMIHAVVWFSLTEYVRQRGLIDWIIGLPVCQSIYLRDSRAIDNVAKWEYEAWKAKTNSLKRKD